MAQKKLKKDFDKEQMYQKIMPSVSSNITQEIDDRKESVKQHAPEADQKAANQEPKNSALPQYILRNFMEDMVLEKLNHTIQVLKGCGCERCKKDVMAMALNSLPPAYMTVHHQAADEAVQSLRGQYKIKVTAVLIKAVQEVKQNPKHEL